MTDKTSDKHKEKEIHSKTSNNYKLIKRFSIIESKTNPSNIGLSTEDNLKKEVLSNNKLLPLNINNKSHLNSNTAELKISSNKLLNQISSTPRTNLERIMEILNDISEEFEKLNKPDYKLKAEMVIKEVLDNKMYKYEEFKSNSDEEAKLLQLYSPDYEDVREEEDDLVNDNLNSQNKTNNNLMNSSFKINISSPFTNNKNTNSLVENIKYTEFGTHFDVFQIGDKYGREQLLNQVVRAAFSYKEVISYVKSTYLDDYVEELRKGYTEQPNAFYHNVR